MALDDNEYLFNGTPQIPILSNSRATPLIDNEYLLELSKAIQFTSSSSDFIYIAGWCMGIIGGVFQSTKDNIFVSKVGAKIMHEKPLEIYKESGGVVAPGNGSEPLIDVLKRKADAGVDVRVLGWISFAGMSSTIAQKSFFADYAAINGITINTVQRLREISDQPPAPKIKALLNIGAHTLGSTHLKMMVVGNPAAPVAFTGGLDLVESRFCTPGHPFEENWHDIAIKIEGPAVQGPYDVFKSAWDRSRLLPPKRFLFNTKRVPDRPPFTDEVPARTVPATAVGSHLIQSVRTIPDYNYSIINCLPENPDVPSAPQGLFQIRDAWEHAISKAQDYIYMEDQSFWSKEVMSWVNLRVKAGVHVILLTSGQGDPADPNFPDAYLHESINVSLLGDLTPEQKSRVRMFKRWGETRPLTADNLGGVPPIFTVLTVNAGSQPGQFVLVTDLAFPFAIDEGKFGDGMTYVVPSAAGPFRIIGSSGVQAGEAIAFLVEKVPKSTGDPATGIYGLSAVTGITVHAKVTLVDDKWAIIGSANCMRRSLYTDWEHSAAFVAPGSTSVRDFRSRLWAEHFKHPTPADFNALPGALHAWNPAWGSPGSAPAMPARGATDPGPEYLQLMTVGNQEPSEDDIERYEFIDDIDSRQPFGAICDLLRGKF